MASDGRVGHGEKLSRLQTLAIGTLLTASTLESASSACGISVRTLRRWMKLPEFIEALRAARRAMLERAITHSQHLADEATETLRTIHQDESAPRAVRVAAARVLAAQRWKSAEVGDLRAELDEIKAMLEPDEKEEDDEA